MARIVSTGELRQILRKQAEQPTDGASLSYARLPRVIPRVVYLTLSADDRSFYVPDRDSIVRVSSALHGFAEGRYTQFVLPPGSYDAWLLQGEPTDGPRQYLPIEDLEAGLYIHDRDKVLTVHAGDQAIYAVDAEHFMEVQRERDNWRRTCALVNAAVRRGDIGEAKVLLDRADMTQAMATAIDEVVAWAKAAPQS